MSTRFNAATYLAKLINGEFPSRLSSLAGVILPFATINKLVGQILPLCSGTAGPDSNTLGNSVQTTVSVSQYCSDNEYVKRMQQKCQAAIMDGLIDVLI